MAELTFALEMANYAKPEAVALMIEWATLEAFAAGNGVRAIDDDRTDTSPMRDQVLACFEAAARELARARLEHRVLVGVPIPSQVPLLDLQLFLANVRDGNANN